MIRARIKALLLLAFLGLCQSLHAQTPSDTCGYRTFFDGTVFTLTISRSFHGTTMFMLCERKDRSKFVLASELISRAPEKWASKTIPLTPWMYERVLSLYESALNYDVIFEAAGLDGSTWCLETKRAFTYSNACFWSPSLETAARRLSGLLALGQELWRISNLKAKDLF